MYPACRRVFRKAVCIRRVRAQRKQTPPCVSGVLPAEECRAYPANGPPCESGVVAAQQLWKLRRREKAVLTARGGVVVYRTLRLRERVRVKTQDPALAGSTLARC